MNEAKSKDKKKEYSIKVPGNLPVGGLSSAAATTKSLQTSTNNTNKHTLATNVLANLATMLAE